MHDDDTTPAPEVRKKERTRVRRTRSAVKRIPECRTDDRKARVRQVLERRQKDLRLVLTNIHDPHNVSAILRSCDAFGVNEIDLFYTDTAFPNLGAKSSASARKWVARRRHTDAQAMVADLRARGFQLLSTGFSGTARPLTHWDLTRPTAILLGNEHRGVSPELEALVPDQIFIPMMGMVQSLNVSVAAAVILYEAFRQRNAAGMYDHPSFSAAEIEALEREWCAR
jgi:tRNA (guanosine-2'-O-)-methyltransferase